MYFSKDTLFKGRLFCSGRCCFLISSSKYNFISKHEKPTEDFILNIDHLLGVGQENYIRLHILKRLIAVCVPCVFVLI